MTAQQEDTARAWLARELSDHQPHVAGGILTLGSEAGYSEMQLRRAARSLGVKQVEACMGTKANTPKVLIGDCR